MASSSDSTPAVSSSHSGSSKENNGTALKSFLGPDSPRPAAGSASGAVTPPKRSVTSPRTRHSSPATHTKAAKAGVLCCRKGALVNKRTEQVLQRKSDAGAAQLRLSHLTEINFLTSHRSAGNVRLAADRFRGSSSIETMDAAVLRNAAEERRYMESKKSARRRMAQDRDAVGEDALQQFNRKMSFATPEGKIRLLRRWAAGLRAKGEEHKLTEDGAREFLQSNGVLTPPPLPGASGKGRGRGRRRDKHPMCRAPSSDESLSKVQWEAAISEVVQRAQRCRSEDIVVGENPHEVWAKKEVDMAASGELYIHRPRAATSPSAVAPAAAAEYPSDAKNAVDLRTTGGSSLGVIEVDELWSSDDEDEMHGISSGGDGWGQKRPASSSDAESEDELRLGGAEWGNSFVDTTELSSPGPAAAADANVTRRRQDVCRLSTESDATDLIGLHVALLSDDEGGEGTTSEDEGEEEETVSTEEAGGKAIAKRNIEEAAAAEAKATAEAVARREAEEAVAAAAAAAAADTEAAEAIARREAEVAAAAAAEAQALAEREAAAAAALAETEAATEVVVNREAEEATAAAEAEAAEAAAAAAEAEAEAEEAAAAAAIVEAVAKREAEAAAAAAAAMEAEKAQAIVKRETEVAAAAAEAKAVAEREAAAAAAIAEAVARREAKEAAAAETKAAEAIAKREAEVATTTTAEAEAVAKRQAAAAAAESKAVAEAVGRREAEETAAAAEADAATEASAVRETKPADAGAGGVVAGGGAAVVRSIVPVRAKAKPPVARGEDVYQDFDQEHDSAANISSAHTCFPGLLGSRLASGDGGERRTGWSKPLHPALKPAYPSQEHIPGASLRGGHLQRIEPRPGRKNLMTCLLPFYFPGPTKGQQRQNQQGEPEEEAN